MRVIEIKFKSKFLITLLTDIKRMDAPGPNLESRNSKLETPSSWVDYELLDSGGFEKLERFGKYILVRP